MKKKVALTAAAVALVGTLAVGGTLAWFTDTEEATNVVTIGDIDVTLDEDGGNDGVMTDGKLTYEDLTPGKKFTKTVTINNVGTNDAYVKAIITVIPKNVTLDDGTEIESDKVVDDLISGTDNAIVFNGLKSGGTWARETIGGIECATYTVYYKDAFEAKDANIFKAGEDAEEWELFESVKIPENWGNDYEFINFDIQVDVEAIQVVYDDNGNAAPEKAFDEMSKVVDLDAGKVSDATSAEATN